MFQLPEFPSTDWVNSVPLRSTDLKGKVILVDFWTYSCINCVRSVPKIEKLWKKYKKKGLVVVGVHSPEFDFEKNLKNIKNAVKRLGLSYPIVTDPDLLVWRSYNNHYWPSWYLFDRDGKLRWNSVGEGSEQETERRIRELLGERGALAPRAVQKQRPLTPELYAGYGFARVPLGNSEGFKPENVVEYKKPEKIAQDRIILIGKWKNRESFVEGRGEIILHFTAAQVHMVAEGAASAEVTVNGRMIDRYSGSDVVNGKVRVVESRLYNIYDGPYGSALLRLKVKGKLRLFTFTFG